MFYVSLMVTTKKTNPFNWYTKDNKKGIKVYYCKKKANKSNQNGGQQERKIGTKEQGRYETRNSSMGIISSYLSIIALRTNGLNLPIKEHRIVEQIKKSNSMLPMRDLF
jgi:hypothetical protein